jgi:hypothetical protein
LNKLEQGGEDCPAQAGAVWSALHHPVAFGATPPLKEGGEDFAQID